MVLMCGNRLLAQEISLGLPARTLSSHFSHESYMSHPSHLRFTCCVCFGLPCQGPQLPNSWVFSGQASTLMHQIVCYLKRCTFPAVKIKYPAGYLDLPAVTSIVRTYTWQGRRSLSRYVRVGSTVRSAYTWPSHGYLDLSCSGPSSRPGGFVARLANLGSVLS
jgi:hypothetical protein